jgi:hypothetical protein
MTDHRHPCLATFSAPSGPQPRARRCDVTSDRGATSPFVPRRSNVLRVLIVAAALVIAGDPVTAQTGIVGWGTRVFNSAWNEDSYTQVVAGSGPRVAARTTPKERDP